MTRKYFDDVLVEIYIDVIRVDDYDFANNFIVKDVDEWIYKRHRIPSLKKILSKLQHSERTKELYPYFGWETYFKKYRESLDDSVHGNRFSYMMLNCNELILPIRVKHLNIIESVLKEVFTMHLAFIFYLNPHYMSSTDYMDYLDCGQTPPEGSETWLASYAQEAFDRYIKGNKSLGAFIKERCCMRIE